MTFEEMIKSKDFPFKEVLVSSKWEGVGKSKSVFFTKAFMPTNGEEIKLELTNELFYPAIEDAICALANNISEDLNKKQIVILAIEIDRKKNKDVELGDIELNLDTGSIPLNLEDFIYDMHCIQTTIQKIKFTVDENTGIKYLDDIKFKMPYPETDTKDKIPVNQAIVTYDMEVVLWMQNHSKRPRYSALSEASK